MDNSMDKSAKRVLDAIGFHRPDRLPRWDNFYISEGYGSEFTAQWQTLKNVSSDVLPGDYYDIDMSEVVAHEGILYKKSGPVSKDGEYELFYDQWGNLLRQRKGATFSETVKNVIETYDDLDALQFDDPADDQRYDEYLLEIESEQKAGRLPFSKIGGIYCRSQFMRREDRLLMDMAMEENFCHELFTRVSEFLTQIALESLRRADTWEAGIWVCDDSANKLTPMFSPAMWEKYLLPNYKKMIDTLHAHGCKNVLFHSDGNIAPFLDLLVEAGFNGLNPLEPRCELDLVKLRNRYGNKFVFFGGICNTEILPRGDKKEIEAHVRPLIELGRDGGLIIGSASIGDDISPETYDYYISLLEKFAEY
jgi:uroporphyrinogen decarboxylase